MYTAYSIYSQMVQKGKLERQLAIHQNLIKSESGEGCMGVPSIILGSFL